MKNVYYNTVSPVCFNTERLLLGGAELLKLVHQLKKQVTPS